MLDKRESGYSSHQRAPVGRSYDQRPKFPPGTDLSKMTFGCQLERGESVREVVNPSKTFREVNEDARVGHELYIITHNDYNPGELKDRKYNWSKYKRDSRFGVPTPHFNDGRLTRKTLNWIHDCQMKEAAKIVSKRLDDFNEKFQHQLGKVNDPIAETMNVLPDHTFGVLYRPEKYGVRELIHYTPPMDFQRGKERHRAVLAAVRQHLKKVNYQNFDSLLEAFRHYDKKGDGTIDKEELNKACVQFGLEMHPDLVDALVEYCDVDKDGLINFMEFANFLNWKDKMKIGQLEEQILTKATPDGLSTQKECPGTALVKPGDLTLREQADTGKTPKTLTRPTDRVANAYRTTSSAINAVVGGPSSAHYRTSGIPSVRTDIAVPRIRSVTDRTNYGDDANAFALLCPSVFSEKGVYAKDFFQSRSKEEMKCLFCNFGVSLPDDTFEHIWCLASQRHPKGEVCIESMRSVMDDLQTPGTLLQ
ncbi:EF-hand domain-containing family member B isoform X2 [Ambystoma mexicanum]